MRTVGVTMTHFVICCLGVKGTGRDGGMDSGGGESTGAMN
jgi:hypothetical protein